MPFAPGYGETPLPHDELTALHPGIADILDAPITRAAVYDLEQGIQNQVSEELLTAAIEGSLRLDELLSDHLSSTFTCVFTVRSGCGRDG